MWTREQLKRNARIAFERNRWVCVLVCLVVSLLGGTTYSSYSVGGSVSVDQNQMQVQLDEMKTKVTSEQLKSMLVTALITMLVGLVIAMLVMILVSNMAIVGKCRYFLENREHKTMFAQMFYGFNGGRYRYVVRTMGKSTLITFAYSFLFLVPGIIKAYSYRLVPYILAENPYMDSTRALQLSEEMMRGHKWESFVFELSFLGWHFLGVITGGILSVIHVEPYIAASFAEYYIALKSEAIYKGITSREELPGIGIEEGF